MDKRMDGGGGYSFWNPMSIHLLDDAERENINS